MNLLITDMSMPDLSGDALAGKVLAIRPDFPIILLTGYSNKVSEESALELGIRAFAHKPVTRKDMARLIRNVLDSDIRTGV